MLKGTLAEYTISHNTQRLADDRNVGCTLTPSTFSLCLLGNFGLLTNETPVRRLDMPRLQSLLAYLALHHDVLQARSRIACTLWPNSTDSQAHTNLRNLLFKLRLILPKVEHFLLIERRMLGFQPDADIRLDVRHFESAIGRAEDARRMQDELVERRALEEAASLYQGDLLPDCYENWINCERDRLRQAYEGVLERLIELLEQLGNTVAAIRITQRLLRSDPLRETAYCSLMRLYAVRGDRSAIVHTYQTCISLLQRELSVEPALATREVYKRLIGIEAL